MVFPGEIWRADGERRQVVFTVIASSSKFRNTKDVHFPPLPEELWLIIFSFLKWNAPPMVEVPDKMCDTPPVTPTMSRSLPAVRRVVRTSPRAAIAGTVKTIMVTDRRLTFDTRYVGCAYALEYNARWSHSDDDDSSHSTELTEWMRLVELRTFASRHGVPTATINAIVRAFDDKQPDAADSRPESKLVEY